MSGQMTFTAFSSNVTTELMGGSALARSQASPWVRPGVTLLLIASIVAIAVPAKAQPAPTPVEAEEESTGRAILERAVAAAGGETWLNPRSLILTGDAVFYGPDGPAPRSRATSYRMWRIFNPDRAVAHAADGMVRIAAHDGERRLFEVGFDGTTTWNERGVVPQAEADAFWASNFGFGIIRQALRDGFTITRVPDGAVGLHPLYMIRITSPDGGQTLFGIDQRSHFIRLMGFATPRGWHVRIYDRFFWAPDMPAGTRWLQAGEVTLLYNGVVQNVVRWTGVTVNPPIDPALFRNPADGGIASP